MPAPLADLDFIGPLPVEQQAWADTVLAEDSAAALFEPITAVRLRREARVASMFSDAAVLFQACAPQAWPLVRRAIAEARALAWLIADDPAGCWDCLLAAGPCEQHLSIRVTRSGRFSRRPGTAPQWHRFGSEAT
jgi:hypothetical protein